MTVVKVDSVNASSLSEGEHLIDEQVPSLNFPIVQHRCILILFSLTICSIANTSSAIFVQVVEEQVLKLPMVPAR